MNKPRFMVCLPLGHEDNIITGITKKCCQCKELIQITLASMEIVEEKIQSGNNDLIKPITIKCPVCKSEKKLKFPKSVINHAKQLTTISIPKGLVCKHHFQAFVDKNFMIRGYQKVDFEYASELIKPQKLAHKNNEKEFFEYIIIEENYLAYKPKDNQIIIERKYNSNDLKKAINPSKIAENEFINKNTKISKNERTKMNFEEIYNEFWSFIDDNNKDFQEFIKKDPRRENLTINS